MKNVMYILYSILFYMYSIFPIKCNKTTFIAKHDKSLNGNIMCMYNKVKKENTDYICRFINNINLNKKDKLQLIKDIVDFIFLTPYHLATSEVIFLDSVFLPMAYMKFRKKVRVVQLWHGCNTLKKFGQLSNKGRLKVLEKKANSRYTDVIVSSKKMIELHKKAFGVSEKIIYPLGLPRMDIFFDEARMEIEKEKFYSQFNELRKKKIILYAPTFRDDSIHHLDDEHMNLSDIINQLPKDYVIINKFHPYVAESYDSVCGDRMIDLSYYEDITRLMLISDILISDYSSIVFDYALLKRPIIYYAYDRDKYEKSIRGFYYNYDEYISADIIKNKTQLVDYILNSDKNIYENNFIDQYIDFKDNRSCDRVYLHIYK